MLRRGCTILVLALLLLSPVIGAATRRPLVPASKAQGHGAGGRGAAIRSRTVTLVPNGGFERGALRPWRRGGTLLPRVTTWPRHHGRYAALLGRLGRGQVTGHRRSSTATSGTRQSGTRQSGTRQSGTRQSGRAATGGPATGGSRVTSTLSLPVTLPKRARSITLTLYAWRSCTARHPRSRLTLTVRMDVRRHEQLLARLLNGCDHARSWRRLSANLSRYAGHTVVVAANVVVAARENAALALDDIRLTATLPLPAPPATPTPLPATSTSTSTPTATATSTSTSTATAMTTSTSTSTPTLTPTAGPTATPTIVPNICAAPAVVAAYQTALPTMTPTPLPSPTATPTITPTGTITPTATPVRHSNIPTQVPPATPTYGPTPGYTALPGPTPTVATACHTVLKGISYSFVAVDGGPGSAATPVVSDADADAVQAAGAQGVRIDFHLVHDDSWTPAEYGAYDAVVNAFCQRHIDVLGLVGGGAVALSTDPNSWLANSAERDGGNGDNPFLHLYAQRVLDLVGHYHDCIHTWELWNEPNVGQPGMTANYMYPSNFAALLADTYTLVKANYPDVTIVSGGIFSHDSGGHSDPAHAGADYLRQTYYMGLQVTHTWDPVRTQFGTNPLDAIGQHLYLDQGGLVYTQHIIDAYRWMHDAYAAFGDGAKPIYMTEGGWSTSAVSPDAQALNLDMLYSLSENPVVPYVARVYWYLFRDGQNSSQGYGLETSDGQPKPALARFQAY